MTTDTESCSKWSNDLRDAMQQKQTKNAIGQILRSLADYTVNHFAAEEGDFAKTNYPEGMTISPSAEV